MVAQSDAWPMMDTVAQIEQMADPGTRPVQSLGRKRIEGREVEGIRFPYGDSETLTVWRDPAARRPVMIDQMETDAAAAQHKSDRLHIIYSNMIFDVPLDDSLFAIRSPEGYTVLDADDVDFNPATRPTTHGDPHPTTQPATQSNADLTPRLQFRLVAEPGDKSDADEMVDPGDKKPVLVLKKVELDERDVERGYPEQSPRGDWVVHVDFTEVGSKKFEKLTQANINRRLAVVFKGVILSAPTIRSKISKSAVIDPGGKPFTAQQAQDLGNSINGLKQ